MKSTMKKKTLIIIIPFIAASALGLSLLVTKLSGKKKPSISYSEYAEKSGLIPKSSVDTARKALSSTSEFDRLSVSELEKKLDELKKTYEQQKGEQKVLLDIIEVSRALYQKKPKHYNALITLADISFDQMLFQDAARLYKEALTVRQKDPEIRARYASALTFLKEYDQAIQELVTLTNEYPRFFKGHAYLAISYAQKGEKEKALFHGNEALELAPHKEAKERFAVFLESLKNKESASSPQKRTSSQQESDEQFLQQTLSKHEIIAPKLIGVSTSSDIVTITLREFPIEKMPPFARDKFFATLSSLAREAETKSNKKYTKIQITSAESGTILATIPLN